MEKDSLELVSTLDLIAELCQRCSPAIFMGSKNEGKDEEGINTFYHYSGNMHNCIGLCHNLASVIQIEEIQRIIEDG